MKTITTSCILTVMYCLMASGTSAQVINNVVVRPVNPQQLCIGDQLPDLAVGKFLNLADNGMRTSDFKDCLLIIDLWATSCGSCIEAMPKLDALQQKFGNRVKILPATYEPENTVKTFWERNRNTKGLSINTVVGEQVFSGYFPHKFISHDIWIYKGKIIAITAVEEVTAANIQKVLNEEKVKLTLKDDFSAPAFDGAVIALKNDGSTSNNAELIKYALVKRFKENISPSSITNPDAGGILRDTSTRSIRTYIINEGIYNAYLWALLNANGTEWLKIVNMIYGDFEPNRVLWEVADRSKYYYEPALGNYDEWRQKNAICFESLRPDTGQTDQKIYSSIVEDLNDLLGLEVHFEKRKVKTLLLTRAATADKLQTKNAGIDASYHVVQEDHVFRLRDTHLGAFVKAFNKYTANPYLIDETKYISNIDLDLAIPVWTDVQSIRKQLQKYGLNLQEEEREIELLLFNETGGGLKPGHKDKM